MEPSPELVAIVERLIRRFESNDAIGFLDSISREPGTLVIGIDQDEWWLGYEEIAAVNRVQFEENKDWLAHLNISWEVEAWKEGTVGWASVKSTSRFGDIEVIHGRTTVVFHEERAYWRVVQWHGSVGISMNEMFGLSLTTTLDQILIDVQDSMPHATSVADDGFVTIVFTDFVGSTALMETLGEAPWLEMMAWLEAVVSLQTGVFGGTVVKSQGDGFMLAFPAVGSATACAVAIQRALKGGWNGIPAPVRIGLHRGNAKAEAGDFFGRTVIVAARVADSAHGGEILVTPAVHEVLGEAFAVDETRTVALKGIEEGQAVFAINWR